MPAKLSLPPFLALAGLLALFQTLAWLRLRAIVATPPARPVAPAPRQGRGIAGAFTANLRREQQKTQHLQEIMRALAETGGASTNTITQTPGGTWLRVSTPKAAHDGVATVVVQ